MPAAHDRALLNPPVASRRAYCSAGMGSIIVVTTTPATSRHNGKITLLQALPDHLARICLFKIITGCREQEVSGLRGEWEINVLQLDTSVLIIPEKR